MSDEEDDEDGCHMKEMLMKEKLRELGIAVMHANEEVSPLVILVRRFVTEKCRQEEGQN